LGLSHTLKVHWGVSISALIVRAHRLGIISDRKYKTLMQRLSARGWKIHEPLSSKVPLERPRTVRQMAEVIYGKKIDYAKLASECHYPEAFVRELIEAHAARSTGIPSTESPEVGVDPAPKGVLKFEPKLTKR
jgi:hypothetical protein